MQPFEFSNNAFSLGLSILSAIVGMAYPLLLQAIQMLDQKYHSALFSKSLLREQTYCYFKRCLFVAIFFVLISLFVFQWVDECSGWLIVLTALHALVTAFLLTSTIALVKKIIIYYDADELTRYITELLKKNQEQQEKQYGYLFGLFDLAKYASIIEDEKLFRKSTGILYQRLTAYVQEQADLNNPESEAHKLIKLNFTSAQEDVFKQFQKQICRPDDRFFTKDVNLIGIWFPIQKVPLSDATLNMIWHFVTGVIDAGKEDWVVNYWTFADQNYRFYWEYVKDEERNYGRRFKQLHLGLGAFMWYSGKYQLLRKVLSFSQTFPPSYSLVDNTFSDIIEDVNQIYDLQERKSSELTTKYYMQGLIDDINLDNRIAEQFCSYFALLILRLKDMDFNVNYREPEALPHIEDEADTSELQFRINIVDRLLHYLLEDKRFKEKASLIEYEYDEHTKEVNLLEQYKTNLEDRIEYIKSHPKIDNIKIKTIKDKLAYEINQQSNNLPTEADSDLKDGESLLYHSEQSIIVPADFIVKNMPSTNGNMEDALVASLLMNERAAYCRFFMSSKPAAVYTVRFMDLLKAWHKMNVNGDYIILNFGLFLESLTNIYGGNPLFHYVNGKGYFNDAEILEINSPLLCVVVIPKDCLPYVEYADTDDANKLDCIDEKTHLYSNINRLEANGDRIIHIERCVHIVHSADTKFILMKVKHTTDSSTYDIDNIGPLTGLTKSQTDKES